jgi:hypothetical protein
MEKSLTVEVQVEGEAPVPGQLRVFEHAGLVDGIEVLRYWRNGCFYRARLSGREKVRALRFLKNTNSSDYWQVQATESAPQIGEIENMRFILRRNGKLDRILLLIRLQFLTTSDSLVTKYMWLPEDRALCPSRLLSTQPNTPQAVN